MFKKILTAMLVVVAALSLTALAVPKASGGKDLSQNLIRFHVIANSDSLEDQQLKNNVRDAILDQVGERFKDAETVGEARNIVFASLSDIETAARKEIARKGKEYPVKAQLGQFDFPAKSYGRFTLPSGNYEAVKVVIGEGKGANWWCVLFPPLCFVDISNSVAVEPEAKKVSKDIPNHEASQEKEEITGYELEAQPVIQFRFKLFEVFHRSRDLMVRWQDENEDKLFVKN